MKYEYRTTEDLIKTYAWTSEAVCDEKDRKTAQALIKKALKKRFEIVMELLDDEQTIENPMGTYKRLIEG